MNNFKKSDLDFLSELIKSKSISRSSDVSDLADKLIEYLKNIGMDSKKYKTNNNCFVMSEYNFNREGKSIIFYSHFDIKKIYKPNEWISDPFELEVHNGKFWGRGVADCKGQLFSIIKAFEQTKNIKLNYISKVRFIFDGGEESGSLDLKEIIHKYPKFFSNDLMIICDGSQENDLDFCIGFGTRGQLDIKMNLETSKKSYHPGKVNNNHNNTIEKLSKFVSELQNYFNMKILKINKEIVFEEKKIVRNKPSLTFTYIDSGRDDVSLVPAQGKLNFEIRTINNDVLEELINEIKALAKKIDINFQIYIKQKYLSLCQNLDNINFKSSFCSELEKILNKKIIFKDQLGFSLPIYPLIENTPFLVIPLANPDSNNHSPNENFNIKYFDNGIDVCKYILQNINKFLNYSW